MTKPLQGIKVLDLTTFVAAPVCARMLGEMGADVIKVEHPKGDGWREYGINMNAHFNEKINPIFDIYNSGKKMISLNLKTPEGKEIFWKLLEEADVFVTNTRPDALKRLGFSYDDVKDRCPKLIYAIILGFGENGPDAGKPAFDTTAFWTRSGFLRDMSPMNDSYVPISPPSGVGDTITGYNLTAQVCAAIAGRERNGGKGDYVKASLYHTGIFTNGSMEIVTQRPWGRDYPMSREQVGPPGGCFRCKDDEWVFVANGQLSVSLPKMFTMIGRPDLIGDERYTTRESRAAHWKELYDLFVEAYKTKNCAEWVSLAKEVDLPCVRMNHFSDVTTDEQAWANGYLENMTDFTGGNLIMPTVPIEMASVGEIKTLPVPPVGTDTEEVLLSMGYTLEEISVLEESGAVYRSK
ncbi:MAG: CoA transferase [Ruminococcaceae bacterium]|nr:CoA transferase [Oscillospiraceae bacterium]